MSDTLEAWGGNIVVRLLPASESSNGIIIPDTAKEKSRLATVLSVGQGLRSKKTGRRLPIDCKAGDTVVLMHNKVADQEVRPGVLVVGEHQIQAVIS